TRDEDAVSIAAEARGVLVDPGDCAPHLFDHREQAAARVVHRDEIENDIMRPGPDERFGLHRVVGRLVAPPRAAMNENLDRRVLRTPQRAIDFALLDPARSVCDALRLADDAEYAHTVGMPPPHDLVAVWRIDLLVVGIVERLLVHVQPNDRTFSAGCGSG